MIHLVEEIHNDAKAKGWWPTFENGTLIKKPSGEVRMLIISEIAEATEEVRKTRPPIYKEQYSNGGTLYCVEPGTTGWEIPSKPEGEAVELADAVIRICDYFGARGWQLENHLKDHIGLYQSDTPLEHHMQFVKFVVNAEGADEEKNLGRTIALIKNYFEKNGWDLESTMRLKIDYNKTRPYRHGGKAH